MNCWETLGIEPTRDTVRIRNAFEQQNKFAEGEEARRLESAYHAAMAEAGHEVTPPAEPVRAAEPTPREMVAEDAPADEAPIAPAADPTPLSASEQQVVREVVIQVRAMLNDRVRMDDAAIWRAILTEPPADQDRLRAAIGEELEPILRPMAEDTRMPAPVARFLGDWFGWYGLTDALDQQAGDHNLIMDDAGRYQGAGFPSGDGEETGPERPETTNFWPAVIGWIVGIIILTSLFGALTGGGG